MKCPYCGFNEDRVLDSRPSDDGNSIRRRRECTKCLKRYTTYEKIEGMPLIVIKRDMSRQPFDREKLLSGLVRACVKRPVSIGQLEQIVNEVENSIMSKMKREVSSIEIGEMILKRLQLIDEVAYVRFASVYRAFDNVESFMNELKKIKNS